MRILNQPIKIIDDFFESPSLWREYALDQEYSKSDIPVDLGIQSKELNILNMNLFDSLASNLIVHIHDRSTFKFLKVNFVSTNENYNLSWIKKVDNFFNIAGIIFLDYTQAKTGIEFFHQTKDLNHNYHDLFLKEYNETDNIDFVKLKKEQREYFQRNVYVKNCFNRCVMFHPDTWHSDGDYFGKTLEDSRLAIKFYGIVS